MGIKRGGRIFWQRMILAHEVSGLSQRAFCEHHKLKHSSFQYWLSLLRKEKRSQSDQSTALVQVQLSPSESSSTSIEARLRNGVALHFSEGTNPAYLSRLISALGDSKC